MKYLNSYKIFESDNPTKDFFEDKINWDLISDLKDISLEYLDNGQEITYSAEVNTESNQYPLFLSSYRLKDNEPDYDVSEFEREIERRYRAPKEFTHWANFHKEHSMKAIQAYEKSNKINYKFMIGMPDPSSVVKRDKNAQTEILERIQGMYPNEKIYIAV